MADRFTNEVVRTAVRELEQELVQAGRQYEDAERDRDTQTAAWALNQYNETQLKLDRLTGANEPQPELSGAQERFLAHRKAMGDDWEAPNRRQDYVQAHVRAVGAGWAIDSPGYFSAVAGHLDHGGDGRQPVLNERSAADLCGISEQEYAQNAQKLRQLKARGYYGE